MVMLRRKLVRDLRHMRGQAIAIALIVASAVAMYVTMRGMYESLLVTQRRYYEQYRFPHVFASLKRAPDSVAQRIREIDGVAVVDTRVSIGVTLDVRDLPEPASAQLISVPDRGEPLLNALHIRRGRTIRNADEAYVSEAFADANRLAPGETLDAVINGRWRKLRIAAVVITPEYINEARGQAFPDNRRFGVLWMRHEELAAATGMHGAFNDLALTLAPGASEADVISAVDRILAPYGCLGAYGRDEQQSHRMIRDELAQDRITSLVIPAIFLAVAALLIHLLLLRVVSSDREQIAVLKAFGYENGAIARHFAELALVIVGAGVLLGVPVGIRLGHGLTSLYTRFFHFPSLTFEPGLTAIAISAGVAVAAALVGSLVAVRRVVALPPAEGMRAEAPIAFGRTSVDRVMKLVSPPVRMILRSMQRRPLRTLMSLVALSTAAMILVVGQFSTDSLDRIIAITFRSAQTDDATITFNEVRGDDARHALARLPGVTRVEPMRVVPVRIRSGPLSKRTMLTGLERDAQLRRLIDADGRRLELPPAGIVLTKMLAKRLGVRAGDFVMVESLEARRSVERMEVTALVDEMIGIGSYASRDAVNRFMREGPSMSGANLAIDPHLAPRLYAYLKNTPAVASVALREAMLESFLKTIAENITISVTTIVTFAAIIAFGVIYNGARIALSERGRDLASLRVLGFSAGEVGAMLIGEQVILTLISIPLGFAAGWGVSAWIAHLFESEVYRIPLVISGKTYATSFFVIAVAAVFTAFVVQRRIATLDLVSVLKTRE